MRRLLVLTLLADGVAGPNRAAGPVRVVFDTDTDSDCDDPGALARQSYLLERPETDRAVEAAINELMLQPPRGTGFRSCRSSLGPE